MPASTTAATRTPAWAAYALALALVAAATVAAELVAEAVAAPNLSLVFVLPVVAAAMSSGFGPAVVAALAGALAYNYFFIPPLFTLRVAQPSNAWALVLLLITASIVSALAAEARRRTLEAKAAAEQAGALQDLAHALVGARNRTAVVAAGAEALTRLFHAPAVILGPGDEQMAVLALAGGAQPGEADHDAARWALASRLPTRGGTYPAEGAAYDFWPVVTPHRIAFAIGLAISGGDQGRPEQPERLVEAVAGYLSVALDREEGARQLLQTRVQKASEQLKTNLLAAVSHDLRTPLSTILVTLQTLRRFRGAPDLETQGDLLALAEAETERLTRMVANLLDMNRLDAGAVAVRAEPAAAAELAAAALRMSERALAGRRLINEIPELASARLKVDVSLFETALANVLENAAKYAPDGAIVLRAGEDDDEGWIEVLDEGPGFSGPVELMFEKFTRGVAGDGRPSGVGLGLAIARGFLEAQGGRIEAGPRGDRQGARVRLAAPLAIVGAGP